MHKDNIQRWQHSHAFGQDVRRRGESRTIIVIALTGVMMIIEIAAGIIYGSMALLADGLHMASHAAALSINAFAYVYARRHAHDDSFSFGTGKVNTLGGFTGAVLLAGFTGAVLLAGFALIMVWESVVRLVTPVEIAFNQAIFVAVIGLVVNGVSVLILDVHHDDEAHDDDHHHHGHGHDHHHGHHHDHNLVSAYLHVLADALTSLLAIFALLGAKYFGLIWADPLMGIVGAVLVARWSWGLLRSTANILLDRESTDELRNIVREKIEADADNRISDLHVWAVGPNIYSVIVSIVTHDPRPPDHYKRLIPAGLGIMHVVIEVHPCDQHGLPVD